MMQFSVSLFHIWRTKLAVNMSALGQRIRVVLYKDNVFAISHERISYNFVSWHRGFQTKNSTVHGRNRFFFHFTKF